MSDFFDGTRASTEFEFDDGAHMSHEYLAPSLKAILGNSGGNLLDLGCGNGTLTSAVSDGFTRVVGLEHSESGLENARQSFPEIEFRAHDLTSSIPEDLRGLFDIVVSAEVIEHLYYPRCLFLRAAEALRPDGKLILTTPYHGYAKNLALAVTNGFDKHWRPNWDHGHIKFFSTKTLTGLANECGFEIVRWEFLGRVKPLAKSMVAVASPR